MENKNIIFVAFVCLVMVLSVSVLAQTAAPPALSCADKSPPAFCFNAAYTDIKAGKEVKPADFAEFLGKVENGKGSVQDEIKKLVSDNNFKGKEVLANLLKKGSVDIAPVAPATVPTPAALSSEQVTQIFGGLLDANAEKGNTAANSVMTTWAGGKDVVLGDLKSDRLKGSDAVSVVEGKIQINVNDRNAPIVIPITNVPGSVAGFTLDGDAVETVSTKDGVYRALDGTYVQEKEKKGSGGWEIAGMKPTKGDPLTDTFAVDVEKGGSVEVDNGKIKTKGSGSVLIRDKAGEVLTWVKSNGAGEFNFDVEGDGLVQPTGTGSGIVQLKEGDGRVRLKLSGGADPLLGLGKDVPESTSEFGNIEPGRGKSLSLTFDDGKPVVTGDIGGVKGNVDVSAYSKPFAEGSILTAKPLPGQSEPDIVDLASAKNGEGKDAKSTYNGQVTIDNGKVLPAGVNRGPTITTETLADGSIRVTTGPGLLTAAQFKVKGEAEPTPVPVAGLEGSIVNVPGKGVLTRGTDEDKTEYWRTGAEGSYQYTPITPMSGGPASGNANAGGCEGGTCGGGGGDGRTGWWPGKYIFQGARRVGGAILRGVGRAGRFIGRVISAPFRGCAFVYSFDGVNYYPEFAVSDFGVHESYEYMSYGILDRIKNINGFLEIGVWEQVPETQYIDSLHLLKMVHSFDTEIVPTQEGVMHTIKEKVYPTLAVGTNGESYISELSANDDNLDWHTDLDVIDWDNIILYDELNMKFKSNEGTSDLIKMVVRGKGTGLESIAWNGLVTALGGHEKGYDKLNSDEVLLEDVTEWVSENSLLYVYEKDASGEWVLVGSLMFGNDNFFHTYSFDLPRLVEGDVEVKLVGAPYLHQIDEVYVDYTDDEEIEVVSLEPQVVEGSVSETYEQSDINDKLTLSDDDYYVMELGDYFKVRFVDEANNVQDKKVTYIVEAEAYAESYDALGSDEVINKESDLVVDKILNSVGYERKLLLKDFADKTTLAYGLEPVKQIG